MKRILKKSLLWILLLPLTALLLFATQPASAQTDPQATPADGYPPPATPVQPDDGYPPARPTTAAPESESGYIPPTLPTAAASPPTVIGESTSEETAATVPSVNQTTPLRNRVILWAGFLITLLLFALAAYGAMLMYTRSRR